MESVNDDDNGVCGKGETDANRQPLKDKLSRSRKVLGHNPSEGMRAHWEGFPTGAILDLGRVGVIRIRRRGEDAPRSEGEDEKDEKNDRIDIVEDVQSALSGSGVEPRGFGRREGRHCCRKESPERAVWFREIVVVAGERDRVLRDGRERWALLWGPEDQQLKQKDSRSRVALCTRHVSFPTDE